MIRLYRVALLATVRHNFPKNTVVGTFWNYYNKTIDGESEDEYHRWYESKGFVKMNVISFPSGCVEVEFKITLKGLWVLFRNNI